MYIWKPLKDLTGNQEALPSVAILCSPYSRKNKKLKDVMLPQVLIVFR